MTDRLILSIESSCDETGIAVIADGRRIVSNVVASQVAMHAASGGIVPEVAARAHLRWIVPVLDEAWADAGIEWSDLSGIAVTYGPGLAGLAARRRELRQGALVGPRPAAHRGQPPRGPRLRGVAARSGRGRARGAGVPGRGPGRLGRAHVPRGDARPPHVSPARARPSTTRRARRSTRSAGCSASATRAVPAIGRAAEQATDRATVFPRAWLPGTYDFSFSGLKTAARRIVTDARADAGLADTPDEPLPEAVVAELSWGFQDSVTDILTTKTIRAAREVGARSIVLGGGVAANSALRARLAGEAEAMGVPADRAATRPVHRQRGDDRRRRRATLRGGRSCRDGPRRATVAAAGRPLMGAAGPPRLDPAAVRATLREAGLRARHRMSQNFLADIDVLEGILAEAAPTPGRRVLEIGPGLGLLTGALLDAGAAVTAVELDRGLAAFLRARFDEPLALAEAEGAEARRLAAPHRGRRARPGPRQPRPTAVRRRREPAVPHHEPDPARVARHGAPAGAERAHGPARGRRADRGATGSDELPLGVRPVPRPGPDRLPGAADRVRAGTGGRIRRSSSSSRTTRTTGWTPRPRTSSGAWSRPRSASDAR